MKKVFLILVLFINCIFGQSKPYVILISIDACRWDYLSRGVSPTITKLKEEGASALTFQPSFPSKTFPNHLTIISGLYPENHGIISNNFIRLTDNKKYSMGDTSSVRDNEWYTGETFWETAHRNGIITASYFWPATEVHIKYKRPDYFYEYNRNTTSKEKIEGVKKWLELPYEKRPHLISLYFDQVDTQGHNYGPDSKEVNQALTEVDTAIFDLEEMIKKTNMADSINFIILSDHGMTSVSKDRVVNIEKILDDIKCSITNTGPVVFIQTEKGKESEIYQKLKSNENHFKVYYKNEVPDYLHYSKNPNIPQIVAIADLGWELSDNRGYAHLTSSTAKLGDHGFDNHSLDMNGIFLTNGPLFKKRFCTGTIWNIDVYPLLCKIFNIQPSSDEDGKLERIGFLLNNY